ARLARDDARAVLRRVARRHPADGHVLSRPPAERRRCAATTRMREALASATAAADAADRAHAARRQLRASRRARPRRDGRAGALLCRLSSALFPAAPPILAHGRVAAAEPVVRRPRAAGVASSGVGAPGAEAD